ncbi:hypothetical protein [Microbacterium sp. SD291]|uniref:hypothetical protein n=1 Tax=Microbacterium sp. SD291 TaxID=2782007 RepID=UPI001A95D283|nr:hypothetical protein [Microbacterium sp. SD291]MBO0980859.1 hypothetical protein [Microbacterium sp. SD291]
MTTALTWPGDSETLIRWIRVSLQPSDAETVRGLDDVRITADVSGADVENLLIDATGVDLSLHPERELPAVTPPPAEPEVVQRTRGNLRTARITAEPMRIEGISLRFDLRLHDAAVDWLLHAEPVDPAHPETIHGMDLANDGAGMHGSVTASLRSDDLAPLLTAVIRPLLESGGIHLRSLDATVVQDGADGIRIEGAAGIRWRLLGASARGSARIGVSSDGVVAVRDLELGSRNPLVAFALRMIRRQVRAQIGKTIDLNEDLPLDGDGPRLTDVRVTARDDLSVSARLG